MNNAIDMTQGSIWKRLILFAVPLAMAHLLQQSYNILDAVIVGHFVSSEALAAVGSSIPITMMIVAFFMGLSNGSTVLAAQFFGAKNSEELKNTVHTSILLSLIIGIVLSAVGVIVSPIILRLIQTPDEVFVEAVIYLRVYFAGLTGLTVYNMGAALLTATGDSKRPLYFLGLSVVVKIVLNLLFVLVFNWGVMAVAWSTVIAQLINSVLVMWLLCRHKSDIRLNLRELRIHKHILKQILAIGLPGGIQGAVISFSNVIVQSYINALGGAAMAGHSVNARLDAFLMTPAQGMALAIAPFVGQNLGSGKVERARRGVRIAISVGVVSTIAASVIALSFTTSLVQIFTTDAVVIEYAIGFIRIFVPAYFLLGLSQIITSALRGAGDVKAPTVLVIGCFVALRQAYLFLVTQFSHTVTTVALGFPIGWFVASTLLLVYYKRSNWSKFEPLNPSLYSVTPLKHSGNAP